MIKKIASFAIFSIIQGFFTFGSYLTYKDTRDIVLLIFMGLMVLLWGFIFYAIFVRTDDQRERFRQRYQEWVRSDRTSARIHRGFMYFGIFALLVTAVTNLKACERLMTNKGLEQSGPAYPPQSVGSADP